MEFVNGGELMSLILKEGGFGEKISWYASQFNPKDVNTVACSQGVFRRASAF